MSSQSCQPMRQEMDLSPRAGGRAVHPSGLLSVVFLRHFIAYTNGILKSDVLSFIFAAYFFLLVIRSYPPLPYVKDKEPSVLPPAIWKKSLF